MFTNQIEGSLGGLGWSYCYLFSSQLLSNRLGTFFLKRRRFWRHWVSQWLSVQQSADEISLVKKKSKVWKKIKNGFICVLECNFVRHQHFISHIFNNFVHSCFCLEKYWRNEKMCSEHQWNNWNVLHKYFGSWHDLWIWQNWLYYKMDALWLFSDFWDIICVLAHSIMLYEG